MTLRKFLTAVLAALLLTSPQPVSAQIANIAPKVPEDPNLDKVTLLRLFYIGGPKAPGICLAGEPQGQRPSIIASNIPSGTFSPYVAMRPQHATLHILDGNVIADPVKPLSLEKKKLAEPIKAELRSGAYSTLVVLENDGKFTASLVADTRLPGNLPTMRVLNLSGLEGWSVRLVNSKNELIRPLWSSGQAPSGISLPGNGVCYVEVLRKASDGARQAGFFECQLDVGTPFTVVLYRGADGEGTAAFAFDASPGSNYDPELTKKIADGVAL